MPHILNRNYFWLAIIMLAVTEVMAVSLLADARGILTSSIAAKVLYYAGDVLKLMITSSAIFVLFLSRSLKSVDEMLAEGADHSRYYWTIPLHTLFFVLFLALTITLFNGSFEANGINFLIWTSMTALTAISFALIISPARNILRFFFEYKFALCISIFGGVVVLFISLYSRVLWEPLSNFTLHGSYLLLQMLYDGVFLDVPRKLLGAKEFVVNVSPQCSGIDGMALAIGITSAYLYFSRQTLSFPKALLLIPIAAVLALLFNVLRVALLVAIGASISETIAIEGFHSVGGWIGSVLIAMLIIFVFSSWSRFQKHDRVIETIDEDSVEESRLATAILIPFIFFMATTLVAGIFAGEFDYLYPIKIIIPFMALIFYWSKYQLKAPSKLLEPIAIGLIVAVLWFVLVPVDTEANETFQTHLLTMPVWAMLAWFFFRILGFWVFAPVVEELVFRCYLLNRLSGQDLVTQGRMHFSVISFLVTSVLFGLIHADWIAGTMAGALFAVARYRSDSMSAPIIAHASANIFVGIWAIATQNWIAM